MSRGAFGTRDIHKAMLDLPFAEYDAGNGLHQELVTAAADAEIAAAAVNVDGASDFIRARQLIRRALDEAGLTSRIEGFVGQLLEV
jgi:hypothetical protein